ncbi:MAG: HAD family hydrolase [Erysipelotrichaceae bacterium]|nr:HAD family hydrolase [Erysipelotrichaceae bacterium]
MKYKLFVFDVDGTIRVPSKHYIPDSTAEIIPKLKEMGIRTVVATGRDFHIIDAEVKALDFDYYICSNGASIYDKHGTLISETRIDYDTGIRLLKFIKKHGDCICFRFLKHNAFTYGLEHMASFRQRFFKSGVLTPVLKKEPPTEDNLFIDELPVMGVVKTADKTMNLMKKEFPNISFTSVFDDYYDFGSIEANKGLALNKLRQLLDIKKEETAVFGDGENDIPMFEAAGISVAMGNAEDDVKASAKYITDDIEKHGLANAIHHLLKGDTL